MPGPAHKVPTALLCPSSHAGIEGARIIGVVQTPGDAVESAQDGDGGGVQIAYLDKPIAVSSELLDLAAPLHPGEIFRFAAPCQTHACPQFNGRECALATRIVQIMPAVVEQLPDCQIRHECRWFQQEGASACRRCPQIKTMHCEASEVIQRVVELPPFVEPVRIQNAASAAT